MATTRAVSSNTAGNLVVVVGPNASGKSYLAMQIAQQYDGEIICADSRTVYKGMDIGTSKPTKLDQAVVPHHLLDIVEPDQPFTAAEFQKLALTTIEDILARGKLPILVGGTGLYIDSVIYNYSFQPANPGERLRLEKLTVEELQKEVLKRGLDLPENKQNPRHLMRLLETAGTEPSKEQLRPNTLIFGLQWPPEEQKRRITATVEQMIAQGLQQEVQALADRYGWQAPGLNTIGYREWRDSEDLIKTKELIIKNSVAYARRQRTWFKRNKNIHWLDGIEQPSVTIGG